jgi:hypothetical protein
MVLAIATAALATMATPISDMTERFRQSRPSVLRSVEPIDERNETSSAASWLMAFCHRQRRRVVSAQPATPNDEYPGEHDRGYADDPDDRRHDPRRDMPAGAGASGRGAIDDAHAGLAPDRSHGNHLRCSRAVRRAALRPAR